MTDYPTKAPNGMTLGGKPILRCFTQTDLDAARTQDAEIWLCGTGRFVVTSAAIATDAAHVVAWGSAHVEARGSAHVVARESAHVEAWESAHVEAWESAHVEASAAAFLVLFGASRATATAQVVVQRHSKIATVEGGIVVDIAVPTTPETWCDWYGVAVSNSIATLYKAVRDDYQSAHGVSYAPGTMPAAPDWDGGQIECGAGLHFSPRPLMAKAFDSEATKFLACPVRLTDMRCPSRTDDYPAKIKAKGCCGPVVEVDCYGTPIASSGDPR